MLLPTLWETPISPDALSLGTRVGRWRLKPGFPEGRNGQGSSLWALTWPLSSKGLIWPFFLGGGIRGGPGTSSKLPDCLAAGNNGAIVGVASVGRLLAQAVHHGARDLTQSPPARSALSPRYCQRQRHPPSPHFAGLAQTLGTSSSWRALGLCPH